MVPSSSHNTSLEASIPPPPPPQLVTIKPCISPIQESSVAKKGNCHENVIFTPEELAKKAYFWFLREKGFTQDELSDFVFISRYNPVKPIIQNGPLCGMVALAMASELIGGNVVSTEDIFDEAKKCHFSLQGELFSASFMVDLASKFLDCDVTLVELNPNGQFNSILASSIIIKALLQNNIVLLPYDADKNHGPCQAQGHKAHWGLVTGFFTDLKKKAFEDYSLGSLRQDEEIQCLHYYNSNEHFDSGEFVGYLSEQTEFKIYAHQGKSKYCGTWNLKEMLESNNNLVEVGPDRNSEEYLLPPGGVKEGLRCKAVFIKPRNS